MESIRIKGIKEQLDVHLEEKSVRTIKHKDVLSSLVLEGFYVPKDLRVTSSNTDTQIIFYYRVSQKGNSIFQQNQPSHHLPKFVYEHYQR